MNSEDIVYKIAATMVPGIGAASFIKTVNACKGERSLFENADFWAEEGIIPKKAAESIRQSDLLDKAKAQAEICQKHNINVLSMVDTKYPRRLVNCEGAPKLLFSLGNANLEIFHTVGIVGTRSCDNDGKNNIFELVETLKNDNINVVIISGLAAGADSFAHQAALHYGLPTAAVLGHGLNMVYPAENRQLAADIVHSGGVLFTEFFYGQAVNKNNFARRNRIVAGLCDAVIVAQSKIRGGALITADLAKKYKRDVFAFPGRVNDKLYAGCNMLISKGNATLFANTAEFEKMMGWTSTNRTTPVQTSLDLEPLTPEEVTIIDILHSNGPTNIDTIAMLSKIQMFQLSSLLLNMEFKDLVRPLPGKRYEAR